MASDELKRLIALKRAKPYEPNQSIASLRGSGPDGGKVPRHGTTVAPCDADGVYCEWVVCGQPTSETVFIFFHGGGYYRSSAVATRRLASDLSAACGCRCLTVDYRLAPENKFPSAVDDAYTVFHWVSKQGINAGKIVVGGSSAGGGLTAALLNKLKREDDPLPVAAVLLSPWTDLTQSADSYVTNGDPDPAISKGYLNRAAAAYLGDADPLDPLASPVNADLRGLPPLLVQVGKSETMYGDAETYVQKAEQAGVDVTFQPYDDVIHGWHNSAHVVPNIPETLHAIERIGRFFRAQSNALD